MGDEPTAEQLAAIETAREMARAGIPIFVCPPNGNRPGRYAFPIGWQKTAADPAALDQWRPGWAVGAVGGGACDFLDLDPRNGSDESQLLLKNEGAWPLTFGTQSTPSGGTHHIISRTGERKETGFLPGIDFQAGSDTPDETGSEGRAFVWLAPTVGRSKVTGEMVPYRWVSDPDLEALDEWRAPDGSSSDASTEGIVARVYAHRALKGTRPGVAATPLGSHNEGAPGHSGGDESQLFGTAWQPEGATRAFTVAEAKTFVEPSLAALRDAKVGSIEEAGMAAALMLEHFVPAFLSPAVAFGMLEDALAETVYDPAGPSDWTSDKFLARLDGRRPVVGSWKATVRHDWPDQPVPVTGRLRRAMLKRSEIDHLPDPVPLIERTLYRSSVTVLAGKFGTYKSFIAVGWAASLATGRDWMGHRVPEAVPVIYAAAEGAAGIKRRLHAWEKRNGVTIPDSLYLIPISVRINRAEDVKELEELIVETKAAVVVFDTFHASTPGLDENDNGEVGRVYDILRGLQERHGICAVLPHHTGHGGERSRGGSSIEDDADVAFVVRLKGEDRSPENIRTLVHRKTKDEATEPDTALRLILQPGTGSGVVETSIGDDWRGAEQQVAEVESGQEVRVPEPVFGDWMWSLVPHNSSHVQRYILAVLHATAGEEGLTQAATQRSVRERWYDGRPIKANAKGYLSQATWDRSWTAVAALVGSNGEPVITRPGEGRRAVNPSALVTDE